MAMYVLAASSSAPAGDVEPRSATVAMATPLEIARSISPVAVSCQPWTIGHFGITTSSNMRKKGSSRRY